MFSKLLVPGSDIASFHGIAELGVQSDEGLVLPSLLQSGGRLRDGLGYLDVLRASRDPQDEARVENLDEFVAVTRDFARNNPEGTITDFLTEVALVSDADDLDDESGSVSLMTMVSRPCGRS